MPDIFIHSPSKPTGKSDTKIKSPVVLNTSKSGMFDSFIYMPDDIRFETQGDEEKVVLFLRKHWFANLTWLVSSFLLLFIPLVVFPLVFEIWIINISSNYITLSVFVWYLVLFSYCLVNFLLWYFTVSIITTERIIDIDFVNILNKKFAETRISKIEDVTQRSGGFIASFFDFGNIYIQTAAEKEMFQFMDIPHPHRVVSIVNQLMGKHETENISNV